MEYFHFVVKFLNSMGINAVKVLTPAEAHVHYPLLDPSAFEGALYWPPASGPGPPLPFLILK